MIAEYIHHSCFMWEGPQTMVVYDFWRDRPDGALLTKLEQTEKQVYFVVSHFHEDHYNPAILEVGREWAKPPRLLISHDVVKRRRVNKELPTAILRPNEHYEDELLAMDVYRSTDVGVSTVITLKTEEEGQEGECCFHAGDLNNWYFPEGDDRLHILVHEMEGLYLSTLRDIQLDHPHIHHAMLPMDPRLGGEILRGPSQWLARIETDHFYPMHTWGKHALALSQMAELEYLFPHTQFHYQEDPESESLYGDFMQRVATEIEVGEQKLAESLLPKEEPSASETEVAE